MTPQELRVKLDQPPDDVGADGAWMHIWERLAHLIDQSRDPQLQLRFIEGGDMRAALRDKFVLLFNIAGLMEDEAKRDEWQGNIAWLYQHEWPRLPAISARLN